MSLTPEELQIVEYGKSQGKTKAQVLSALGRYRQTKQESSRETATERITGAIKDAPSDIAEGFRGVGEQAFSAGEDIVETARDKDLSLGEKLRGVGGRFFSGIGRTIGEAGLTALKLPFSERQEGRIKEKATDIAQDVVESKPAQDIVAFYNAQSEDTKREIRNALGFAEGLTEIGGAGAATRTARKGVELAGDAFNSLKTKIDSIDIKPRAIPEAVQVEGKSAVKDFFKDIKPKADEQRDRLIARSLKLAPVEDISVVNSILDPQGAGVDTFGDFMGRYNLIGDTADETVESIARFKQQNLDAVSDAVALVDAQFDIGDVPGLPQTMDFINKQFANVDSRSFKQAKNIIDSIGAKDTIDLTDVLTIRKIADEFTNFYKRSGEVKEAITSQNMAENIGDIRRFIEAEVNAQYPDQIDIKELNKNVRASSEILNSIVKRSGKNDTESLFKLGDMAIIGAGNVTAPGAGFAGLVAKKVFESSPIQLRMARQLDSYVDRATKGQFSQQEFEEVKKLLQEELGKSFNE